MLRFTRSVTRWLLAVFAVSMLLAWPLHQAQHASQPAGDHAWVTASAAADDAPADGDDAGAGDCLWCLFHAEPASLPGTPPALRFHAEASPPPAGLSSGLPAGRCPLAAQPRGPPQA